MSERTGPLADVRIVDLTQALAGPFCTMLLADLGAEVLKVESLRGDGTRPVGPWAPDDKLRLFGGYFQSINRNKRSIAIDLKQPEGREILHKLVARADVLAENFRAGVMDRLGLSYESLRKINPRLVYACIRGFGDPRTGESPYVDRPAYDIVAQAMGGLMGTTGPAPDQPMKTGPAVGDIVPAMLCAVGILAAVRHADRTGEANSSMSRCTTACSRSASVSSISTRYTVQCRSPRAIASHSYVHSMPFRRATDG
jgi:crotonobetainyl-CoA:carnitine CoA-transferase CaiB-like acyl-CoA transferase